MDYILHSTAEYHREKIHTLGWALTLCNALDPPDSPCRQAVQRPASYGDLLYDALSSYFRPNRRRRIVEIGGGYGAIMRDFLKRQAFERIVMIDISSFLLEEQRKTIDQATVEYRCEDFLDTPIETLADIEWAIMNENLGDFPTMTHLNPERLSQPEVFLDPQERTFQRFLVRYGLSWSGKDQYTLNVGALSALEKLCLAGIPLIFIAEHSCEAKAPRELKGLISLSSSGSPERIPLMGHEEFTLRFSDLQIMAKTFGYDSCRGPIAELLGFSLSKPLKRLIERGYAMCDRDEIILQFVGDLYQYEYLILSNRLSLPPESGRFRSLPMA